MAKKQGTNVVKKAELLAQPVLQNLGLMLWDVRFVKEGAEWYLRYFIDKDSVVDIDDCEAFSRAIDPLLDEADFIEQSYFLEVCSPGLNRELTKPEHFKKCLGWVVTIKLFSPIDDKKEFVGILDSADDTSIVLNSEGEKITFDKKSVAQVRVNDEYKLEN